MSTPSLDQLTAPFHQAVEDHSCPYAERVLFFEHTANLGTVAFLLSEFERDLARIHADGTCPPTHIDNSPTTEWSDLVRATRR